MGSAAYECMQIPRDYATFVTDATTPEAVEYGTGLFWMNVLRTAFFALCALVLLARTDWVLALLGGKAGPQVSAPAPNQSPEPTPPIGR